MNMKTTRFADVIHLNTSRIPDPLAAGIEPPARLKPLLSAWKSFGLVASTAPSRIYPTSTN